MKASESHPIFILYLSAFKTKSVCLMSAERNGFNFREEKQVFSYFCVEPELADDDVNASLMNK